MASNQLQLFDVAPGDYTGEDEVSTAAPEAQTAVLTQPTAETPAQPTQPQFNVSDYFNLAGISPYTSPSQIEQEYGKQKLELSDYFPSHADNVYAGHVQSGDISMPIYAAGGTLFPFAVAEGAQRKQERKAALEAFARKKTVYDTLKSIQAPEVLHPGFVQQFNDEFATRSQNLMHRMIEKHGTKNISKWQYDPEWMKFVNKAKADALAINEGYKFAKNFQKIALENPNKTSPSYISPASVNLLNYFLGGFTDKGERMKVEDMNLGELYQKLRTYDSYNGFISQELPKLNMSVIAPEFDKTLGEMLNDPNVHAEFVEQLNKPGANKDEKTWIVHQAIKKVTHQQASALFHRWADSQPDESWKQLRLDKSNDAPITPAEKERIAEKAINDIIAEKGYQIQSHFINHAVSKGASTTINYGGAGEKGEGGHFGYIARQSDEGKLRPDIEKEIAAIPTGQKRTVEDVKKVAQKTFGRGYAKPDDNFFAVHVGDWETLRHFFDPVEYSALQDSEGNAINYVDPETRKPDPNVQSGKLNVNSVMIGYATKNPDGSYKILTNKNMASTGKIEPGYELVVIRKLSEEKEKAKELKGKLRVGKDKGGKEYDSNTFYKVSPLNSGTSQKLDDIAFPSSKNVLPGKVSITTTAPSSSQVSEQDQYESEVQ